MDSDGHTVCAARSRAWIATAAPRHPSGLNRLATCGLGLTLLAGSLLSNSEVSGADPGTSVPPPQAAALDKWHPGIYVKIEDWQLVPRNGRPDHMPDIYRELAATPGLRGIKVVMKWGRYETRTNGVSTYDFGQIDTMLAKLGSLDNKHLILCFPWREFQSVRGASDILPNDLQRGVVWGAGTDWEHWVYDYLWAYKMSNQPGKYGYNLKLWDATIMTRLDAFFAALAQHLDKHPNLTMISTTESAIGDPVIPFGAEESQARQEAGQRAVIRLLKKHFVHSFVVPDLNFSREQVAKVVAILEDERIGFGSSNSNKKDALIRTTPASAPGVLTYYPGLSGEVLLAPEIQGMITRPHPYRGTRRMTLRIDTCTTVSVPI